MKRKSPFLMIATLWCVSFFSSCQKEANLLPQGSSSNRMLTDPIDPWSNGIMIPLAGNAFITKPAGNVSITSTGLSNWSNSSAIASTYFRVGTPGALFVALNAAVPSGTSTVKVIINGQAYTLTNLTGSTNKIYRVGMINVSSPGYVKVDMQGVSNTSSGVFANVSDIIVYGSSTSTNLIYANDAAHYSDSRAGAGVRLEYTMPGNASWFYNQITVPVGADKAGTNYISNGFSAGNAGLQLTASGQKRITFNVLNSGSDAVKLVKAGAGTTVDASVTNGKSVYLPFNWVAGTSYKFITQAKVDGNGNTSFSAWVYTPEDSQWKFIASCSRANAGTYLTGLYSSLQGINPENGYAGRSLLCYNQWINTSNTWTEITSATFKGDATATNNQRLDYGAGAVNSSFNLKTQGFFPDNSTLNTSLTRAAMISQPSVDLTALP